MTCPCQCKCQPPQQEQVPPARNTKLWLGGTVLALGVWAWLYSQLIPFSHAIAALFPLEKGSALSEAVIFFFYDTPKVFLLLTLVVFAMGIVRSFFSPERTRALLAGKHEGVGNIAAACLGIVTPFCSCSAVPLFIGFVSAGVPLGVTFSFLISAPLVNEVALGLLFGLLGWKIALLYLSFGLGIAIVAGWTMGRFHLEHWLEDWVRNARAEEPSASTVTPTVCDRIAAGIEAVREIVGKVWPWMIAGIGAGALIHGYAPAALLASIMGQDAWWSVPASVLIGVPLYANAAGIIPIVEALLGKGAALGTALAFMMAVTALSLPEAIILRKVLTLRLVLIYFSVVAAGILIVGYAFNAIM